MTASFMEPVFMILGQSAGTAACIVMEDEVYVLNIDYGRLRKQLIAGGQ